MANGNPAKPKNEKMKRKKKHKGGYTHNEYC